MFRKLLDRFREPPALLSFVTEQLYLYARQSLRFLLLVVLLVILILSSHVPSGLLWSWSVLIIGLIFRRLYVLYRFEEWRRSGDKTSESLLPWYRRFQAGALLTALLIGISVPLFMPYLPHPHLRFLLLFFIIGVSSGALTALFPSLLLSEAYILLLNLPLFFFFLTRDAPYALTGALVLPLYVIVLLTIAQTIRNFMMRVWQQSKTLEAREGELKALFEQTPIPIFYFDTDLKIRKYNQAFHRFFRIPQGQQIKGFDLRQLRFQKAVTMMRQVLETRRPLTYEGIYLSTFSSMELWIHATIAPLYDEEERLIGGMISFQDKTLEKQSIERLESLASRDILTGLGNRRSFYLALESLTARERSMSEELSLLFFIDLDQFKPINDTLGHQIGDRVLSRVARILRRLTPSGASVFRLGGDEFIVLCPTCCRRHDEARRLGERFVNNLNRLLQRRVVIDGYQLPLRGSVGIVVISAAMRDPDEIVRRADVSMYQAKGSRQGFAFYDPELDHTRQQSFHLRQALNRDEIVSQLQLIYQPIVSVKDGTIRGAEALLRWHHPTLGELPPDAFIPLAVESGEIGRIGRWVTEEVCRTLQELRQRFPRSPLEYLSFNLDSRELNYEDFPRFLERTVREYGIHPPDLVLEITENSLIDNFTRIQELIDRIHTLGIRWAIDDFGVGYSSLSYLERLSFDILKIDRSFIRTLEEEKSTVFLVEHIMEIARHMGYQVVVEGVETPSQFRRLAALGPESYCQGFLFSRPVEKESFFQLLSQETLTGSLKHPKDP